MTQLHPNDAPRKATTRPQAGSVLSLPSPAMPFSHSQRGEIAARQRDTVFDLLIVGGGITGAGIARDAALRGLKVALVEKGDFGSGTSSKSSKLIHGGLRYLEQLQLGLVFEATSERSRLIRHAPHLARPLPFIFPIYRGATRGPLVIGIGMWIYDALSLFRNVKGHRRLSPAQVLEIEPDLRQSALRAAMIYYDAMTDDARLTLENARAAHEAGAAVLSYVRFEKALREDSTQKIAGGVVRDLITGEAWSVRANVVVFSAGPWTDEVRGLAAPNQQGMMRPTKGVHIVVPRHRLPVKHAVVMSAKRDKRVVFALPWEESTALGTTDTDYDGDIADVAADRDDVDYLIETAQHYFPEANLTADDVVSTWAGLRPLVRDDSASAYATSREHTIMVADDNSVVIAGGKLTTYRRMASECVDTAVQLLSRDRRSRVSRSSTAHVPLTAGDGLDVSSEEREVAEWLAARQVPDAEAVATHWVRTYGRRWRLVAELGHLVRLHPQAPVMQSEIEFAVEQEMALTLEDFLVRRTHLHFHLPDQAISIARHVAEVMAQRLGWDEAELGRQLSAYDTLVARNRRWRNVLQDNSNSRGRA